MALQFVDFKKRVNNHKEELAISFHLEGNASLAIIDNSNNLNIFRKIFEKTEDYRGNILVNGIDIRKKSELYDFSDVGLYSNFTLYQNFKFLLKIYSIKLKKEELISYFEELVLDKNKKYKLLDDGEKERVHVLLTFLLSKDIFLVDMSKGKYINSRIIANFLGKVMKNIEKNIIVLTKENNEISSLMSSVLVINDNKQEYFGKRKDFDLVRNLAVLQVSKIDNKELEQRLPFDFTIVNNKIVLEKSNLEAALYYFVSNNIEIIEISDFSENKDLYVKGE